MIRKELKLESIVDECIDPLSELNIRRYQTFARQVDDILAEFSGTGSRA